MTRDRHRQETVAELSALVAATEVRCEDLEWMVSRQLMRARALDGPAGAAAQARALLLSAALEQAEYELACARLRRDERARRRAEHPLSAVPDGSGARRVVPRGRVAGAEPRRS